MEMSTWPWQRKSFYILALAALAICWTGFSFRNSVDVFSFIIICLSTFGLVMFVYGFDVLMDEKNQTSSIRSPRLKLLFLLALLTLALAFCFLGRISFWAGLFILVSGFFYTYPFSRKNDEFRIKSILFLKNVLIGISWGFLIFFGANEMLESTLIVSALFVCVQVTLGSILRDFDDLQEDQKNLIYTIPLKLGFDRSIYFVHILNFFGIFILFIGFIWNPELKALWLLWSLVLVYRGILIELIRHNGAKSFLLQQANVAACGLILLLRLVEQWIF